jgi:hypothetical protein
VLYGVSSSETRFEPPLLKTTKEFSGQLAPSVTLDEEGKPKVTNGGAWSETRNWKARGCTAFFSILPRILATEVAWQVFL